MTGAISKDLSVTQGYEFNAASHLPLGFISHWTIGASIIAPDIQTVDPTHPTTVVAVLSHLAWSTLPNENITLSARISVANAQQLRFLAARPLANVVTQISLVTYAFDPVSQVYYPSFQSFVGAAPNGAPTAPTAPGGGGFGTNQAAVYALITAVNGIKIGTTTMPDPAGIPNETLDLTLAPPIAAQPQQFRTQTSPTVKAIAPWGIPQS